MAHPSAMTGIKYEAPLSRLSLSSDTRVKNGHASGMSWLRDRGSALRVRERGTHPLYSAICKQSEANKQGSRGQNNKASEAGEKFARSTVGFV